MKTAITDNTTTSVFSARVAKTADWAVAVPLPANFQPRLLGETIRVSQVLKVCTGVASAQESDRT